jgi:glutathione S-transferase
MFTSIVWRNIVGAPLSTHGVAMKLFYSPGACSLAPHIVLREAGQAFTLSKVDLGAHKIESGDDYFAVNSKGSVPLLELDDGSRLSEGPVITQFIADQNKATSLMPPAGTMARYRVMEWQNFITSELHKAFGSLFHPELDAKAKQTVSAQILKKLAWVDGQLAGRTYLTGDDFTAADAYLFTVAGWSKHVGLDISGLANLQRFLAQVGQRPAVREALKAEGLLKE